MCLPCDTCGISVLHLREHASLSRSNNRPSMTPLPEAHLSALDLSLLCLKPISLRTVISPPLIGSDVDETEWLKHSLPESRQVYIPSSQQDNNQQIASPEHKTRHIRDLSHPLFSILALRERHRHLPDHTLHCRRKRLPPHQNTRTPPACSNPRAPPQPPPPPPIFKPREPLTVAVPSGFSWTSYGHNFILAIPFLLSKAPCSAGRGPSLKSAAPSRPCLLCQSTSRLSPWYLLNQLVYASKLPVQGLLSFIEVRCQTVLSFAAVMCCLRSYLHERLGHFDVVHLVGHP